MRKGVLVIVMALVLSLTVTAAAFAHSGGYAYFSDGHSGWVSNGHHGYYWSGDFSGKIKIDVDWKGNKYCCPHKDIFYLCFKCAGWNDGNWYYYKDKNGVIHYYYDDGDDGWKYYSYVDKYGNTQYSRTKVVKIS